MAADIQRAIARLHDQLPLQARQRALPSELADIHRAILRSLAERGMPLSRREIAERLGDGDVDSVLQRLGNDDLVVLNPAHTEVVGAYPMTVEDTPHHLNVHGRAVNAMCALDAVAVGPMFNTDVKIDSTCRVTGERIRLVQRDAQILEAEPNAEVRIGVRWQDPTSCAAHSMCREMVFLKDEDAARAWQGGDEENFSIFTLPEAIAFGAGFFQPLL